MEAYFLNNTEFEGYPICQRGKHKFPNITWATTDVSNVTAAHSAVRGGYDWFSVIIPIICTLGIVGNILNLLVLTRRRLTSSMDCLEISANYGLIALAISDMLFCAAVIPYTFLEVELQEFDPIFMYYKIYGLAFVNLSLMISTWLIVSMAIQRYIVVVYPLHARLMLGKTRTFITIIFVYILSIIATLPNFIFLSVTRCVLLGQGGDQMLVYAYTTFNKQATANMTFYMHWIWPIIADFIPLLILGICNARLIRELRRATRLRRQSCRGQTVRDTNHKVTLTLVVIVLMLFFLVSPAEFLKYINPFSHGEVGKIIAKIANTMQTLNFAFNFVLYCLVNASFRATISGMCFTCFKAKKPEVNDTEVSKSLVTTVRFKTTNAHATSASV